MEKYILSGLAEVVIKNNIFKFGKNIKQKKSKCNWNKICTSL